MTTNDDFTLAWFVGLFEGEGTFTFSNGKPKNICISMTDLDVLEKVQGSFGGSIYPINTRQEHWKPAWKWQLMGYKSVNLAKLILPYLMARRSERCRQYIDNYVTIEMHKSKVAERKARNINQARALHSQGSTQQQIADVIGVDRSTIAKYLQQIGL